MRMSIFKKATDGLRSIFAPRANGKAAIVDTLSRIDIFDFNTVEKQINASHGKVWATYKSCKLIADVFISTDWSIQLFKKVESIKLKEVDDILANPNPHETFEQMLWRWVFHMRCAGMAFWYKDKTTADGKCSGLWTLNPKRMKIYLHKERGITGFGYWVNGVEIPFTVDEIIYWRRPHPDDDIKGIGDIEAGGALFQNFDAQQNFQKAFLESGGSYSQILVYENEVDDEAAWVKMKARWDAKYSGSKMAGKTAWLSGKWSSIKHGMSLKDMMHIEGMQMSTEQIFALHGIPFSLAGVRPADNMSSSRTEDIQFRRYTVLPDMMLFTKTFNRDFIFKFTERHEFVFNLGGLANIKEIVDDHKDLIANAGLTPNELRQLAGFPRAEDPSLDEFYIGTHLVPLKAVQFLAEMEEDMDDGEDEDGEDDPEDRVGEGEEGGDNRNTTADDNANRDNSLDKIAKRITNRSIVERAKKNDSSRGSSELIDRISASRAPRMRIGSGSSRPTSGSAFR